MLWSDLERLGRFWDPWNEFNQMQRALSRWTAPSSAEFPPVNVWLSADEAIVTTEIPGVNPQSIDISVVGKTVTIRGSRDPEKLSAGESYHRRERWTGQFSKSVEMPFSLEAIKVEAKFNRGILEITTPRAEAEKPKKISIKAN
jgi:HSP20 family protein